MAQYGDQYGHVQNHEELDSQTAHDINTGGDMAGRGIVTHEGTRGINGGEHPLPQQEKLHRTSSSSSSSSEDEGEGGIRKKKGITEKIMDKIPGVGHKQEQPQDTTTTAASAAATMPGGEGGHGEEKKGLMDKIKEKLPGVN